MSHSANLSEKVNPASQTVPGAQAITAIPEYVPSVSP